MSRFASLLPRSLAARSAPRSLSSFSSRSFSSFSSSTPSHSPPPPSSSVPSSASTQPHRSTTVTNEFINLSFTPPATRDVSLSELNSRGKELAGEDYDIDSSAAASTTILDSIDSSLGTDPSSSEDLVFEEMKLSDILQQKQRYGTAIHSVATTDRIVAATELMNHMNIGAVLVRDAANATRICGIVSTRDIVRKIQENGLHPLNSRVEEFMTPSPVFAYSDETAISCLQLMTKHNFRHLPVKQRSKSGDKEQEKTIGLVSIGDLVRVMLKQYRESNVYLREYIDGKYGQ